MGNEYKLDEVALKNEDDCDDVLLQPSSNLKTFLTRHAIMTSNEAKPEGANGNIKINHELTCGT